ncbi:hypothetical protein PIB30_095667 [Stylosanthes scabra]|uniref:Uncharacterized protein n=1 Tax=Stylosanthes scabra TaxID=79078 RepID=A0ABU6YU15_9FABA|nr:hypothetical protein [Stylosanthes scabra]
MVKLRKHIIHKFEQPEYRSRTLRNRKLSTPSDYDRRIDEKLVNAGFFHISQIRGKLTSQSTLISALVERWDPVPGPSTPMEAGTKYDLRTENSRRSPNRFTPSGWSTKNLKKGASRIYKNAKDRLKKN